MAAIAHLTRRHVLAAAGAAAFSPAYAAEASGWTRQAFQEAMRKSGRPVDLTDPQFAAIQARKPAALSRIESYLKEHLQTADPAVLRAFDTVPREYFQYNYADRHTFCGETYETEPKPWAIGYGSALSDYLGQAYMTQVCRPTANDVTLEIGTGSGFQSSLLSRIVKHAYTIEIIEPLGAATAKLWNPLGYDNRSSRVGDGYYGWPEVKDGFDIIIVTCAAQYPPPDLFKQLKPGGRMVIPIGQPFKRGQVLYIYTKDDSGKVHSKRDVGVFFIPMTGTMMTRPQPVAAAAAPEPAAAPPAAPAAAPPAAPAAAPPAAPADAAPAP